MDDLTIEGWGSPATLMIEGWGGGNICSCGDNCKCDPCTCND